MLHGVSFALCLQAVLLSLGNYKYSYLAFFFTESKTYYKNTDTGVKWKTFYNQRVQFAKCCIIIIEVSWAGQFPNSSAKLRSIFSVLLLVAMSHCTMEVGHEGQRVETKPTSHATENARITDPIFSTPV